jgi:hypothetical protein
MSMGSLLKVVEYGYCIREQAQLAGAGLRG